jgi:predicted dehydrogenase
VKALIIGHGHMGAFHKKALSDLGYDVTTVDPDVNAGADYTRTPHGSHYEVVCIACPIEHLAEQAAGWASSGVQMLIEKPMASNSAEARELAAVLAGRHVAVGYIERFNPMVRHLQHQLANATWDVSPDLTVSATFIRIGDRPSTDIRLDLLSHGVDLARWMRLDDVDHVVAAGGPKKCRSIQVALDWHDISEPDVIIEVDLTAHPWSPIHSEWHWFLSGRGWNATPANAAEVLAELERTPISDIQVAV